MCVRDAEVLDSIEAELHYQNDTIKKAEQSLSNMEKCCGMCICPWAWRRSYGECSLQPLPMLPASITITLPSHNCSAVHYMDAMSLDDARLNSEDMLNGYSCPGIT